MTCLASSGPWRLQRGATVLPTGGTRFSVWAPAARAVALHLPSRGLDALTPMHPDGSGLFRLDLPGIEPGEQYTYRLDGGPDRPDPVGRSCPAGVHGPSAVVDPDRFPWTDQGWRGRPLADCTIYELHVGTFTAQGTFDAVISRLPYLHDLGITAIELMPAAEFPGARNWGYDGASLYAPESAYGGPEGLRRLVDAAHAAGIAVFLDVVYNHLGPEGNYLAEFGPYFTDRYRTPWGSALNYDGPGSDEVRRFAIENALYWITEYHLDGLRLDAVHSIYDFSAHHILEELAAEVHEQGRRLGRTVLVVAESDRNDPRLVRAPAEGGYGLDGQWSDDFHHAVHAELTGERAGYYADFGGLATVAQAIQHRHVYAGRYSAYRRRRHGAPAHDVPADRFVVAVQNHDQVGNRARGERLAQLLPFSRQKLAAALLLLSPYVPLLFMGEEYGETNPFLYFVSHDDPALADAVRRGRREEFRAFGWTGEIPDPQAEATFAASRLDWTRTTAPGHRGLLALYTDLLTLRRTEPALRPGAAATAVNFDASGGWLTWRLSCAGAADLLALFSFDQGLDERRIPLAEPGSWTPLLCTEDQRYEGQGRWGYDGAEVNLVGSGAVLFRG